MRRFHRPPRTFARHVDEVWRGFARAQKSARTRDSTNDNITKDGRTISCEWYNTPLVDDSGRCWALHRWFRMSPSAWRSKKDSASRRKWKQSAALPAASRTTSTIC